ncbi:hypothetical protein GAT02_10770 [Phocaeicola vulgatus]|nr:hypothetical protein GAT02_10770 [Phocaeicola vulgatus]
MFYPLNYRALCNSYRYNFLFLFTINLNFTTFALVWKNIRLGNSSCGPGVLKKYAIDKQKPHTLRVRFSLIK